MERIGAYRQRLAASGARLTDKRLRIMEILLAQPGHHTADQILAAVRIHHPRVNKTTIYRTLEWLSQHGLVTITNLGDHESIYESAHQAHHHLICRNCGLITELDDATFDPIRQSIQATYGFAPLFHHVALFGVCRACQERADPQMDTDGHR